MKKQIKPRFQKGQVLAVSDPSHPYPRPRYIFVDAIHQKDRKFFYQDAAVTATIGWPESSLRQLTEQEAGQ